MSKKSLKHPMTQSLKGYSAGKMAGSRSQRVPHTKTWVVEGAVGEERRPWTNFMED
jgi:hypothetical protein